MSGFERQFSSLVLQAMGSIATKNGLTADQFFERLAFLESPEGADTITQIAELSLGLEQARADSSALAPFKTLSYIGTINIPFAGRFIVAEHFVVNTGNTAVAKVSVLGDNFKNWFLTEVEGGPVGITLSYHQLLRKSVDELIIKELGGEAKVEASLVVVWHLMCQQRNREPGVLITNGEFNVFYVLDVDNVLRAVVVSWHGGGWDVSALSLMSPSGWDAGCRVFSHNL